MNLRLALPLLALVLVACGGGRRPDFGDMSVDSGGTTGDGSAGTDAGGETDLGTGNSDGGGATDAGTDAGPEPCGTAGATETVPCGMCGTVNRFCTSDLTWVYGVCMGETGVCTPGATTTMACGMCGTQTATCNATCTWDAGGACTGEGVCAPGARTRTSMGCPAGQTQEELCNATCTFDPSGMCMADGCPTPGTTESVACGMCGMQNRFCDASHVWNYSMCTGEGVCAPGTTGSASCGMCGTQTTHCSATCAPVPFGMCTGEGVCTPGATMRTATGCPAGQMHVMQCDAACGYTVEVSPCTAMVPVDVTFLLDATGSNQSSLAADVSTIETNCITPLLALAGVQVGVSYSGEFPVMPYGNTGDRPFQGGLEPTTTSATLFSNITARPLFMGSDADDATVEALSMLSGGGTAMSALPLACSPGRVAGGCWRTGTQRVIVIHTDSPIHNGPDPASTGSLLGPYAGISPAPATWPNVRTQLTSQNILILWLDSDGSSPAPAQFDTMLTDLGQPLTDHHLTPATSDVTTACGQIVTRVRTLAGL